MDQVSSVAVVRNGGEILMGKRRDSGRWTLPGGGMEDGEYPEEAGLRELQEEAGIKTNKLAHLTSKNVLCEDGKIRKIHAFKTFYDGPTTMVGDPDQEVQRWQWIDFRDGLPDDVIAKLHSPKNVVLQAMGLQKAMLLKEDVHPEDQEVKKIRDGLAHWHEQRDYVGEEWDGIEFFHFELAKYVKEVAVESAGWYKYPSSKRRDRDGKDWRLITRSGVIINCHSILHDKVWSLATTIYKSKDADISKLKFYGDEDHWQRSMIWSYQVAKVLETSGFSYPQPKKDMKDRAKKVGQLYKLRDEIWPEIVTAARDLGIKIVSQQLTFAINEWSLTKGTIGMYSKPDENHKWGIIVVHPSAFDDHKYLKSVMKHELIHAALQDKCDGHSEKFHKLADEVRLERKYRKSLSGMDDLLKGGPGSGRKGHRTPKTTGGDCYESAAKRLMDKHMRGDPSADKYTLVHAQVIGQGPIEGVKHGHAWLEKEESHVLPSGRTIKINQVEDHSQGREIEMPAALYYHFGRVDENRHYRYIYEEMRRKVVEHKHWGPWDLETETGKSEGYQKVEAFQKGPMADLVTFGHANHPAIQRILGKRGGKIIGYTQSGKPIYEAGSKMYHSHVGEISFGRKFQDAEYTDKDHREAGAFHEMMGNHDEAEQHRVMGVKRGWADRDRRRQTLHIGERTLHNSEKIYLNLFKSVSSGGKQYKYIRKYRRGNRWVYVYREPGGTRPREIPRTAADKISELAEHGHPHAAGIERLSSAKLDKLRELADIGHEGAHRHLKENVGINREAERMEESMLGKEATSSHDPDPLLDNDLGKRRQGVFDSMKEKVDEVIFRHLAQHRGTPWGQKLQESRITINDVMIEVNGDTMRSMLNDLHRGLQKVDQDLEDVDNSQSANDEVKQHGYGGMAYRRVVEMFGSDNPQMGHLPRDYNDVHTRGGEMPSVIEMQAAQERRRAEAAEQQRREEEERAERLANANRELEGSMAHHMMSLMANSSDATPEEMLAVNDALKGMFDGAIIPKEDFPYDFTQYGYRTEILGLSVGGGEGLQFQLQVYDQNNRPMMSQWTRSWGRSGENTKIYNSYMQTNPSARGQEHPIGELINSGQYELLKKYGKPDDYVSVGASLDVGGYNWANQGFKFSDSSEAAERRRNFKQFLKEHNVFLSDEELSHFTQPCHFAAFHNGEFYEKNINNPIKLKNKQKETRSLVGVEGKYPLTQIEIDAGETSRMMVHLGKKYLLGSGWNGKLKVSEMNDNNETWKFFQNYKRLKINSWQSLKQEYQDTIQATMVGGRSTPPAGYVSPTRAGRGTMPASATRRGGGTIGTRARSQIRRPNSFGKWAPSRQQLWIERNTRILSRAQSNSARVLHRASVVRHRNAMGVLNAIHENSTAEIPKEIRDGTADPGVARTWYLGSGYGIGRTPGFGGYATFSSSPHSESVRQAAAEHAANNNHNLGALGAASLAASEIASRNEYNRWREDNPR